MRPRHALIFVCALLGALAVAGGAATAPAAVTVTLAPVLSKSVPQGRPLRVIATFSSPDGFAREVEFRLSRAGQSGSAVTFQRQFVVVPAGTATDVTFQTTPSQWFGQLGSYEIELLTGGNPIGQPMTFEVMKPRVRHATFANVSRRLPGVGSVPGITEEAGPCVNGGRFVSGAAWADVNADGRPDLFLPRADDAPQLFINLGPNGFRDEAAERGIWRATAWHTGAVFVDIDNDGDPDLYISSDGPNALYRNDGTGRFTDVTAKVGLSAGTYSHTSASFGDYDGDGRLDVYVATYGVCGPGGVGSGQPDQLFHQNPDGTFSDVSSLIKPARTNPQYPAEGLGLQAAWFDYNGDGRQDIYLANDFLGPKPDHNYLWRNDGPGPDGTWRFTDVSIESGTALAMNTMGIGIGDYNHDLKLDMALSNIQGNAVLRNNGDGTFTDVTSKTGGGIPFQQAGRPSVTWGLLFADLNLDTWEDLYIAAGYLRERSPGVAQRNQVLMNDRGSFLDFSAATGGDDSSQSRGVAADDFDRDGRVDLFVVDQIGNDNARPRLLRNVTPRGGSHWLEVKTVGTKSNRDGCGALLRAALKGVTLVREVFCGSVSLSSGSENIIHFGLGSAKLVPRLTVTWPSGARQTLRNVNADKLITVTEPKT